MVAIGWLGMHVGRLVEAYEAMRRRVHVLEGHQSRMARLMLRLERRGLAKPSMPPDWRDSGHRTEQRDSGETRIELGKPWAWWRD